MENAHTEWPDLDYTAKGIQFTPWPTEVQDDELYLGKLSYENKASIAQIAPDGLTLGLPAGDLSQSYMLEAYFVSVKKRLIVKFGFGEVIAFRVLDENALLELWDASQGNSRPARTTFRARGHKWQAESFLAFMSADSSPRFSYFVATEEECLEVVCKDEPVVSIIAPTMVDPERIT